MITADFAILTVGTQNTECRQYIKKAVQIIKNSGLNYQLTAMGTQIESDNLEELYDTITKAQEAVFEAGTDRLYTVIKIDDRRDKDDITLKSKIDTVEEILN